MQQYAVPWLHWISIPFELSNSTSIFQKRYVHSKYKPLINRFVFLVVWLQTPLEVIHKLPRVLNAESSHVATAPSWWILGFCILLPGWNAKTCLRLLDSMKMVSENAITWGRIFFFWRKAITQDRTLEIGVLKEIMMVIISIQNTC